MLVHKFVRICTEGIVSQNCFFSLETENSFGIECVGEPAHISPAIPIFQRTHSTVCVRQPTLRYQRTGKTDGRSLATPHED